MPKIRHDQPPDGPEAQALDDMFLAIGAGDEDQLALALRKVGGIYGHTLVHLADLLDPGAEGARPPWRIHEVFGGQERGGIATPSGCPFVFLFTGESGEQFGYSDGWRPDGIFAYTGEGQSGDMEFVRGNRAIRDHLADGRDLLLFEATRSKGNYRYIGCFAFAGWETVEAPDREANQRKAIVFELVPVAEAEPAPEASEEEIGLKGKSLAELRALALTAAATPKTPSKESQRTYYVGASK
jgi:5-methylcytosine-specific restriction protein A